MDILQQSANYFSNFFRTDYMITAGKRGQIIQIILEFAPHHFFHLAGLHKLSDLPHISQVKNKHAQFHDIEKGILTYDQIQDSALIHEVVQRLRYFDQLEALLKNDIIIRFDPRRAYTSIFAQILLYKAIEEDDYLHLFFSSQNQKKFFPTSFFCHHNNKYIVRQEIFKILSVEKIPR